MNINAYIKDCFYSLYTILTLHAILIFSPKLKSSFNTLINSVLDYALAMSIAYCYSLFLMCRSTPFNNKVLTIYLLFANTAYINGVNPSLFWSLGFMFLVNKYDVIAIQLFLAALCNIVSPM